MTQIPEKIEPPTMTTTASEIVTICPLNQEAVAINQLIDYITAREKNQLENDDKLYKKIVETAGEVHTMYKELTSRIDTIAGNQLEMKGGKRCPEEDFGFEPKDQPKRWRAELRGEYFYVRDDGCIRLNIEYFKDSDDYRHAIGNYFFAKEDAEAYKAKLLADNAQ